MADQLSPEEIATAEANAMPPAQPTSVADRMNKIMQNFVTHQHTRRFCIEQAVKAVNAPAWIQNVSPDTADEMSCLNDTKALCEYFYEFMTRDATAKSGDA